MKDNADNYREIITKAVCGSGNQVVKSTDEVFARDVPSSILGCWIINHEYKAGKQTNNTVQVEGRYDINIWYAFRDNTKTGLVTEEVHYYDEIPLQYMDQHALNDMNQVTAKVIKQPTCNECRVTEDEKILVDVEKEFAVEVIGETKVKVQVIPVPIKRNPSQTPAVKRVK